MEEFREYWERFVEWLLRFLQSRWIKSILLSLMLVAFIAAFTISLFGSVVTGSWYNTYTKQKHVYGHLGLAIPGAIISILGFMWTCIIMYNEPSSRRVNFSKFYRSWKLWYWMPTLFALAIIEFLIWVYIRLLFGKYVQKDAPPLKKEDFKNFLIFKKSKLWYWFLSFGIAIIIEVLNNLTKKITFHKIYYWDVIFFLILMIALSLSLGSVAYIYRGTYIWYNV